MRMENEELIKMLTIPKIHVGINQEIVSEKLRLGTYDKVLTKTLSVNITINPNNMDSQAIRDLMNLADTEIKAKVEEWKFEKKRAKEEISKKAKELRKQQNEQKNNNTIGTDKYFK